MVSVRPTIKVLKTLAAGGKLPERTASAYQCAKRATEPEVQISYLREAVEMAQIEVALVTYAQARFDQGIFELLKSVPFPVYESRDRGGAAWRGAVVQADGEFAWLVHADVHDRFLREVGQVLQSKKAAGTLGPSSADLRILRMQLEMEAIQEAERVALQLTLSALKNATVLSKAESVEVGPLEVEILVSTTSFEDWDIGDAHNELELVTFEIANWQSNHRELKEYLRLVFRLLRADETMAETLAGSEYRVQIGISRAELVALLDIAVEPQQLERRSVTPPNYLHYSTKTSLTESFVTGKAVRAICGKWWVPVGDEQTHRHLPVCPECERLEPFAQALRAYLRGVTGR